MPEVFVSLDAAAKYENIAYNTLVQRMKRSISSYQTKLEPRENGKARVLIAISSLSEEGQQKYKAERRKSKFKGDDLIMEKLEGQQAPWYVEIDQHWYINTYREQYDKALALADLMREFNNYDGDDRTGYAKTFAAKHDMTQRTLYRMSENYLEASMWVLKYGKMTGAAYDYFKVLALCRKPKMPNKFPSLSEEMKATVENIWFDRKFRANRGSIEMLYSKLAEHYTDTGEAVPSYQTVARYIKYLMENQGGSSAAYLAERGTREWKNKMMVKGERDTKSVPVMGIVQGDEHTFDCWVSYTHTNGKVAAIRPKLVAWIDTRSRFVMGDVMCLDANAQIIKQSFLKLVYGCGVPEYILIDNGKDYTAKEMTGRNRNERCSPGLCFDNELKGFYRSMGVKDDMRSLPYQPWSKGQIERFFGTVCSGFTKWVDSYTGTLTGSRTICKVKKDVDGMLARGELLTMEDFFGLWRKWLSEVYHVRPHKGLQKAGEQQITPLDLFENGERYLKPAPPEGYAAMLLMKAKRVHVGNTGIHHKKLTYMCENLQPYIGKHVDIKYDPEDLSKIYAYTTDGQRIGEAQSIELLKMGYKVSSQQLEEHKRTQNRQLTTQREKLEQWTTPYELRTGDQYATPKVTGGLELMAGNRPQKVVSLPIDSQYRQELEEVQSRREKSGVADFYDRRGQETLDRISKLG